MPLHVRLEENLILSLGLMWMGKWRDMHLSDSVSSSIVYGECCGSDLEVGGD